MDLYKKVERDLRRYKSLQVSIMNDEEQIEIIKKDIKGPRAVNYDNIPAKTNESI